MSFSKQFTGKAAAVLAAIAAFPAAQRAADEQSCTPGATEGHAKQIAASVQLSEPAILGAPADADLAVTFWGHANADESGDFGYSVQVSGLSTPPVSVAD